MNKLKLLDLFSGIGGFSLGFENTGGFETIAFCEKDKFCQSVLAKHWNNIKIYDEIRNLKGIQADVITGGFPCQPFSTAGKRKGTDDDRYLWDETLRVVAETKPRWFVGENVEGIVNISEGKVLQQIQKDLESEDFQVQCLIIPASGVGAWHQRKRVWIIANSKSLRSGRRSSEECGTEERKFQQTEQKRSSLRSEAERCSSQNVSNSKKEIIKHTNGERCKEPNILSKPKEKDGICGERHNGSSGNKTWWQTESKLCGVPNGVSYEMDKDRTNRIKALGNSIIPEIAYEIAKAILVAENGKV